MIAKGIKKDRILKQKWGGNQKLVSQGTVSKGISTTSEPPERVL